MGKLIDTNEFIDVMKTAFQVPCSVSRKSQLGSAAEIKSHMTTRSMFNEKQTVSLLGYHEAKVYFINSNEPHSSKLDLIKSQRQSISHLVPPFL